MKTKIVKMRLGDLEFLKDNKTRDIEKDTGETIETIVDKITKETKIKLGDYIYISYNKNSDMANLFGIQYLKNNGYKRIYKTSVKYNFWTK